jgi:succinate dehydrogenase / fumarate reductase, cytochrome b subunit
MPTTRPVSLLDRHVLARRAFSLSGVLPLGIFLVSHAMLNALALQGDRAFAAVVDRLEHLPALAFVEWALVFAPLFFHAAAGLWMVVARQSFGIPPRPYSPAVRMAIRATGVLSLAFVAMHLPELRFHSPGVRLGGDALATVLVADLSSTAVGVPWRALVYLAGTACVTFHFATGLWGLLSASRTGKDQARLRAGAALLTGLVGAGLWITFAAVVVFRATGSRWTGGGENSGSVDSCAPQGRP